MTTLYDAVAHPKHYTQHPSGVECIQITEHMNFNLGNVVKYIWRSGVKHETPIEDLKKAAWYLQREIELREPKTNVSILDAKDSLLFVDALIHPRKPNARMKKALKRHNKRYKK